ncbi:MAG: c-type cytochrome [Gammaproteobacteria bacterium]|nr:c-type cytochrome [Gammaproteobacteria bacterium]
MSHEDQTFIRTAGIVLAALVAITIMALVLASFVGGNDGDADPMVIAKADEWIAPVGERLSAEPSAASETMPTMAHEPVKAITAAEPMEVDGAKVTQTYCFACHGTGVPGSPQIGDSADWAGRIAQGIDTLYDSAINGKTSSTGVMPPKGGMMNLSDEQVKAAVDYMVSQAQ